MPSARQTVPHRTARPDTDRDAPGRPLLFRAHTPTAEASAAPATASWPSRPRRRRTQPRRQDGGGMLAPAVMCSSAPGPRRPTPTPWGSRGDRRGSRWRRAARWRRATARSPVRVRRAGARRQRSDLKAERRDVGHRVQRTDPSRPRIALLGIGPVGRAAQRGRHRADDPRRTRRSAPCPRVRSSSRALVHVPITVSVSSGCSACPIQSPRNAASHRAGSERVPHSRARRLRRSIDRREPFQARREIVSVHERTLPKARARPRLNRVAADAVRGLRDGPPIPTSRDGAPD